MHIIIGESNALELQEKYTLLELDLIKTNPDSKPHPAYCVLENIPVDEISKLEELTTLHSKMIENYRKRNWKFCEDALEHLQGRWNAQIDTFYVEMSQRIAKYKEEDPGEDWDYSIHKY